ncbi:hypothetical protein ACKEQ2_006251 [Pseudomonas aeruginosa]|nr:hypothetical protein [Pseudomonas aeruginosa]ELE9775508.1 hypothetical protein [Pseudomonas aeruginosa]
MNGPEITIVEGTTFGLELTWEDTGPPRNPIDLTGCAAVFRICPASSKQPLAEASTEDGGIDIDGQAGRIRIRLAPGKTAGTSGALWQAARYEVRVMFPSDDVQSLVQGRVRLIPAVIE